MINRLAGKWTVGCRMDIIKQHDIGVAIAQDDSEQSDRHSYRASHARGFDPFAGVLCALGQLD